GQVEVCLKELLPETTGIRQVIGPVTQFDQDGLGGCPVDPPKGIHQPFALVRDCRVLGHSSDDSVNRDPVLFRKIRLLQGPPDNLVAIGTILDYVMEPGRHHPDMVPAASPDTCCYPLGMDNIGGCSILPRLSPMGDGCCLCGDCNGVCVHRRDLLHTHMTPSSFRIETESFSPCQAPWGSVMRIRILPE